MVRTRTITVLKNMGTIFGNPHIIPYFIQEYLKMDMMLFLQVTAKLVLIVRVKFKETIKISLGYEHLLPQFR